MPSASIDTPLTEAELDRLEEFLATLKEKDDLAMGLEELDGFLTALIVGPESVPPSEYLQEIFGSEVMSNFTRDEAEEILGLIFRHWNTIADTLGKGEFYDPVYTKFENELPCANDWSHGFMRGASMRYESWKELLESEEHGGAVFAMMLLDHEHDPDPELRPPPLTSEKRKQLLGLLEAGIVITYRYFKPHRELEATQLADDSEDEIPRQQIRTQAKIGRNEPCPCGSGKKYKRCCGGAIVQ